MRCYECNTELDNLDICNNCGKNNSLLINIYELSSICYNDALNEVSHNRITQAIILLKKAIQINSKNIDALNLLGLCYFNIGEFSNAFKHWIYSINEKEYDNIAHQYLNDIEKSGFIKKIKLAIEGYNKSIDFINEDNDKFAIMQLKKVIKSIPNFLDANLLLSILLIKENEFLDAYKILKNILSIDISNIDALRYKSKIEKNVSKQNKLISINKSTYKIAPKNFSSISIGTRVLSILIGFIIGICFMVIIAYPAIKNNQSIISKDIFVEKNREIEDMKARIEETNKVNDDLNKKMAELKVMLDKNGKDNKEIIDAIYNSAKQKYDSNDIRGAKQDAKNAINLGGSSSQLFILYLRSVILIDGVEATNDIMKDIEEKFKDDLSTVQMARDIISATKELNNG